MYIPMRIINNYLYRNIPCRVVSGDFSPSQMIAKYFNITVFCPTIQSTPTHVGKTF